MTEEYCEMCGRVHGVKEIMLEKAEGYVYNKFKEVLSEALILALIFRNTRCIPNEQEIEKHYDVQGEINKFLIELIKKKKEEGIDLRADDIYLFLLQLCIENMMTVEDDWIKKKEKEDTRRKFIARDMSYG